MTAPVVRTLIDELLDQQRELTAVAQFARAHDRIGSMEAPYRELLPLSAPRPGEQYAFEVDLDKCSGCKACVTACHSLNGLDEGESWREVGALFGEKLIADPDGGNRVEPLQQIVTTACHHCVEPGCLEGCPVLAYDKDPHTGIVRHLDDQCIGCSYCILKCPYDVPKYSAKRGIVRKCDMCHGRLAVGEAPACVQACPSEAIRITLVEKAALSREFRPAPGTPVSDPAVPTPADSSSIPNGGIGTTAAVKLPLLLRGGENLRDDVRALRPVTPSSDSLSSSEEERVGACPPVAASERRRRERRLFLPKRSTFNVQRPTSNAPGSLWLPDAPSPSHTLPTTRYLTKKGAPNLRSADHEHPRPQPPHWPLILMLVLTQAGIGGIVAATMNPGRPGTMGVVAMVWFFTGLTASVFHLGRPAKAWRIWLGWRTSWLSREAIALNLCAAASAFAIAMPIPGVPPAWRWVAVASGVLALMTQAMVYADTHRKFWSFARTAPKFFGTSVVLALAFALLGNPSSSLAAALLVAMSVKLGFELAVLKHADVDDDASAATLSQRMGEGLGVRAELRRTAVLQRGRMRPVLGMRLCFGICGGILLPFLVMTGTAPRACVEMAFVLCVLGEFAERYLFFTTVAPDRMP